MKRKIGLPTHLALAGAAMMALGATWTWTNGGTGTDWTTCGNWNACSLPVLPQYPNSSSDSVIVPDGGQDDETDDWTITLDGTRTIAGISINEDVEFEDDYTLTMGSFSVSATDEDVEITVVDDARIVVE